MPGYAAAPEPSKQKWWNDHNVSNELLSLFTKKKYSKKKSPTKLPVQRIIHQLRLLQLVKGSAARLGTCSTVKPTVPVEQRKHPKRVATITTTQCQVAPWLAKTPIRRVYGSTNSNVGSQRPKRLLISQAHLSTFPPWHAQGWLQQCGEQLRFLGSRARRGQDEKRAPV